MGAEVQVNLEHARAVTCKACGSAYFQSVVKVKRISEILSRDGREHIFPIPTLVCLHCKSEIGTEVKKT